MFDTIRSFSKLVQLMALTIYVVGVGILLVHFAANVVVVMALLSLLPMVLLWRLEHLHTRVIPWVALVAVGSATLFEATAYKAGIWYELSPSEYRLFDLIPVEAFVAAVVHLLFLIVAYEYFLDDSASESEFKPRSAALLLGGVGTMVTLGLAYVYLFSGNLLSYSYAWLLLAVSLGVSVAVALVHRPWVVSVQKAALFATLIYPISLMYEYVALSNNLRFFANPYEYIYSFEVLGQPLPLEELLFLWLVPFWLATIYELYVDDGE